MKKFILLIVLGLMFSTNSWSQAVITFSDPNFKALLLSVNKMTNPLAISTSGTYITINANWDDEIQEEEAQMVKILIINDIKITSVQGIEKFTNLQTLKTIYTQITFLDVSALKKLEILECRNNSKLATLNIDQLPKLNSVEASSCAISNLTYSGLSALKTFNITQNKLVSIEFDGNNQLQTVFAGFDQSLKKVSLKNCALLKTINFTRSVITDFTALNLPSLESLTVSSNKLTAIDVSTLPNLRSLDVNTNKITELNTDLNPELKYFYCANNQLNSISVSNNLKLENLDCGGNAITSLDLDKNLVLNNVDCSYNKLQVLDISNNKNIYNISCGANLLTHLNVKNGQKTQLSVSFGGNPTLKLICCDEESVSKISSTVALLKYKTSVSSFCSLTPGGDYNTVSGTAKINCATQPINLKNIRFKIEDGEVSSVVASNGNYTTYTAFTSKNSVTVTPLLSNDYYTADPSSKIINFTKVSDTQKADFCLNANGVKNDIDIRVIPTRPSRPGLKATYDLVFKNKGNTLQSGTIEIAYDSKTQTYSNASEQPTVSANKLTWSYVNLQPFENRIITLEMIINKPTDVNPILGGEVLLYKIEIKGIEPDVSPLDNTFTLGQLVVNSRDPNDKTCLQGDIITPDMVGEFLDYVIRFENVGTAEALQVVIEDVIDTSVFDIQTLQVTNASHVYTMNVGQDNKVVFSFDDINLPFDDANNDGYIAFKIKTKSTLKLGDKLKNKANIYFDFNLPIITNLAVTTVQEPPLSATKFDISNNSNVFYPNPAKNTITFTEPVQSVSVYDMTGKLIAVFLANDTVVNVSKLSKGFYVLNVTTPKGVSNYKLYKE